MKILYFLSFLSFLGHVYTPNPDVNVKLFGAVGNGKVDDTKSIQDALNYAHEHAPMTVFFPKGTYIISRTKQRGKAHCLYNRSGVSLIGVDRNKSIIKLANGQIGFTRMLYNENIKNVIISHLTFDGNCSNQKLPEEHMGGVWNNSASNISIIDCKFINTCGDGVGIRGPKKPSQNITIRQCIFNRNQRNGITLGSGFNSVTIDSCSFLNRIKHSPIDSEPGSGKCSNVTISNCHIFRNNSFTMLTLGGHIPVSNYLIENNSLENCTIFSIRTHGAIIRNNTFRGDKYRKSPVTIFKDNTNFLVEKNKFETCTDHAISIIASKRQPEHIRIVSNQIASEKEAILIRGGKDIDVISNSISRCNAESPKYSAIEIKSTMVSSNILIDNNRIRAFKYVSSLIVVSRREVNNVNVRCNWLNNIKVGLEKVKMPSSPSLPYIKDLISY